MWGWHVKKHANKVGRMHESKGQHIGKRYSYCTVASEAYHDWSGEAADAQLRVNFTLKLLLSLGPEPAHLDWYGHCVVRALGGLGACSPRKIFKIRYSEIASEAIFGPKMLLESPHL